MTAPLISIFIVNYNTGDLLEQCLKSIFNAKGDLALEVFVADNNSTDSSPEMVEAKFPEVSLTSYSKNMGYTKAINALLPLGKGEYCLLVHPDLEILPNTLKQFVEFFECYPQAGILGGNLYYPDGTPNPCEMLSPGFKNDLLWFAVRLFKKLPGGRKLVGDFNPMEWSHKSTSQVNWVWNACMMVRREVFEKIGYFDNRFFVWYADWDICRRAVDEGWQVYYVRQAIAIHHERQSFSNGNITSEKIRYKVDGWYSAARQMQDRHLFLRKYCSLGSIYGIKSIHILENFLRMWLILANFVSRRTMSNEASFQVRMCLQTIQAILRA